MLSARNKLRGKVVSVDKDKLSALIKIEIEAPSVITAFITREAADELELEKGDTASVVIKATEVMVLKD